MAIACAGTEGARSRPCPAQPLAVMEALMRRQRETAHEAWRRSLSLETFPEWGRRVWPDGYPWPGEDVGEEVQGCA